MTSNPFDQTSRYFAVQTATYAAPDGRTIAYVTRRVIPQPGNFTLLERAPVNAGDRLDLVADRYLGDALQFWRIADCNLALNPFDLMAEPGGTVDVCLPLEMSSSGDS